MGGVGRGKGFNTRVGIRTQIHILLTLLGNDCVTREVNQVCLRYNYYYCYLMFLFSYTLLPMQTSLRCSHASFSPSLSPLLSLRTLSAAALFIAEASASLVSLLNWMAGGVAATFSQSTLTLPKEELLC